VALLAELLPGIVLILAMTFFLTGTTIWKSLTAMASGK